MGFGELNRLENNLATYKNNLSEYQKQLKVQEKRIDKVTKISSAMRSVCEDSVDDVNGQLNKMISNVEDSFSGIDSESKLTGVAKNDKEKSMMNDKEMGPAYDSIYAEIRAVNNKISELQGQIHNTQNSIVNTESAIRREKHNIAAGYQAEYNNAQNRVNRAYNACQREPDNAQYRREYNNAVSARNSARSRYNQYRSWL